MTRRGAHVDRGIAVHEAGHATVACLLGGVVSFVSVEPEAGSHGRAVHGPMSLTDEAVVTMSGGVAQMLLSASTARMPHNYSDQQHALGLAGGDHNVCMKWHTEAKRLVLEHQDAIERVASALLQRGTLSGREVVALVHG